MTIGKKWVLVLVVAVSAAGGALGATLFAASPSSAASNATSTTSTNRCPGRDHGAFHPNESAQHEAAEDAGRLPSGP